VQNKAIKKITIFLNQEIEAEIKQVSIYRHCFSRPWIGGEAKDVTQQASISRSGTTIFYLAFEPACKGLKALCTSLWSLVGAQTYQGTVIDVSDGDTLTLLTPEMRRVLRASG
jgi:hypothetical protein